MEENKTLRIIFPYGDKVKEKEPMRIMKSSIVPRRGDCLLLKEGKMAKVKRVILRENEEGDVDYIVDVLVDYTNLYGYEEEYKI